MRSRLSPLARRLRHIAGRRECPVCGRRVRRFADAAGRREAACPFCGCLERHRLLWLYLVRHTEILNAPLRVVHIAPDPGLDARLRSLRHLDYSSGDVDGSRGHEVLDLLHLPMADATVDGLIAYHVLEHVPDDARALREVRRVLRPGGWALLQVPITTGATREDPAAVTAEQRRERFGQEDHVRHYGVDFPDRVRAAGLDCRVDVLRDEIPPELRRRHGLEYADAADPADPLLWHVVRAERPAAREEG